jgi:transposase
MVKRELFWLSDDAWKALEQHLPHGKPGKPRVDDRRVISGILHVLKVGCRWRDVPPEYGPAKTVYNRYHRWSQRRIWQRMFEKMAASGPVPEELSIDSTHVKAHRSAQGSKRGRELVKMGKKLLARQEAEERAKYIVWPMIAADRSLSP